MDSGVKLYPDSVGVMSPLQSLATMQKKLPLSPLLVHLADDEVFICTPASAFPCEVTTPAIEII